MFKNLLHGIQNKIFYYIKIKILIFKFYIQKEIIKFSL